MEIDEYIQMSRQSITSVQERARKDIEDYMVKSDIKTEDPTKMTRVAIGISNRTGGIGKIPTRLEMAEEYEKLSEGKIKGTAKLQARKYAELIYQPTTYAEVTLNQGSKQIGKLKIICTLPEHAQAFANYWIGKTIDSLSIDQHMKYFNRSIKGLRISRAGVIEINDNGKVDNIGVVFSYV